MTESPKDLLDAIIASEEERTPSQEMVIQDYREAERQRQVRSSPESFAESFADNGRSLRRKSLAILEGLSPAEKEVLAMRFGCEEGFQRLLEERGLNLVDSKNTK